MKTFVPLFFLLLSGCSAHYTTESFIYQDSQPEKRLNIAKIQSELNAVDNSAVVSSVSLKFENGITLRGIKLMNKDALVNIVFFSANGMKISSSSRILNKFSLIPANVIWFDYQGMGVSDKNEKLSITSLRNDALQVFDFSKNDLPANLPIVIHGLSMGSVVASYVASSKETDALILDGAITTVSRIADNLMSAWSKPFYSITLSPELEEINNVDFLKKYRKPLLLLVGENDSTTPAKDSEELYNISPSKLKFLSIITNTEHAQTMKKGETIKAYQDFINRLFD